MNAQSPQKSDGNRFEALHKLQYAFAAHIRDPENAPAPDDVEDRRMGIYRELFYNNIRSFISFNFPVLKRLHSKREWDAMIRDFYVRHRCHTPLFPELPREFLQYVEEFRGEDQGDPPFMLELAHYEWVELALALNDADPDDIPVNRSGNLMDEVPVISPVAWRLSYRFPVHQIKPDYQPTEPPAQPTHLIVYRAPDFKVRFLEINPVTARLVELMQSQTNLTGLDCLKQVAIELGMDEAVLVDHGSRILETLHAKHIVLGTAV